VYRAAVIGHTGRGNYGHGLDLAFAGLPGVEVVAVADADDAGRGRAAVRTGAARAYGDYRELLERERLDLVAVASRWPDQHEAMIGAAVRAGVKAIYCEKPLAGAPDEADRILAACDARGVKLAVAHHNRVRPAPRFARDLVAAGKIGRLRMIRTFGKSDRRSGGEDLLVLGTHLMDLLRFFAGAAGQGQAGAAGRQPSGDARWCHARVTVRGADATPSDVGASATEQLGPIAGDDVVATFGFGGGVTATFESAPAADGGGSHYFHLELCGTAGILALWSDPGSPVYFYPRPFALPDAAGEWQRLEPPPLPELPEPTDAPPGASTFFDSNRAIVRDLLAAVETDRPPVSSGHDARAALEMILAVYESHVQGGRVSLPLQQRTHPLSRWSASRI
jgi:predicted dehydrogenase